MAVRVLRELRRDRDVGHPDAGHHSDVVDPLRAFYYGKDAQLMTGAEFHDLVAFLSQQPGVAHSDIEDRVLRLRTLGEKKACLAKHIREHCSKMQAGSALQAPFAPPAPPTAQSDSQQSSRSVHPEYDAGGHMSQLLYPCRKPSLGQPPRSLQPLPEQQPLPSKRGQGNGEQQQRQRWQQSYSGATPVPFEARHAAVRQGESDHKSGVNERNGSLPYYAPGAAYCEDEQTKHDWPNPQDQGIRQTSRRRGGQARQLVSAGTVRSELIETQEEVIERLRTQVTALTTLLQQGVEFPLALPEAGCAEQVRVWFGNGGMASPEQGWQWSFS